MTDDHSITKGCQVVVYYFRFQHTSPRFGFNFLHFIIDQINRGKISSSDNGKSLGLNGLLVQKRWIESLRISMQRGSTLLLESHFHAAHRSRSVIENGAVSSMLLMIKLTYHHTSSSSFTLCTQRLWRSPWLPSWWWLWLVRDGFSRWTAAT